MEVYKRETEEVVRRFHQHRISFPTCMAELDAALAAFMPMMTSDNIDEVRAVMMANNETVMKEMELRGTPPL